ncbi:MAG: tRNA guanosine(34) transglycosylase Tgt [Candidatus Eisenbacteria sp.]|nr:tRNA guanosine(34) transglycosylase Tgt [Candidatus Eisenbacteria bacterium]
MEYASLRRAYGEPEVALLEFRIVAVDAETKARAGELVTPHGVVETPVFMPVGTQATVKALAPSDLEEIGARIVLSNAYHLYLRPGTELIREAGGIHRFMGWDRAILTDSGGFQVFSIARLNRVTDDGLEFQSHLDGSRHFMSPEQNVAIQRDIGADIIMALDECVAYPAERSYAARSHELTLKWARRALDAWREAPGEQSLFGIVQGATYADLRRESAAALAGMEFPGYAIGGLAVGEPKGAMREMVDAAVEELPEGRPRYFMGQGFPEDIIGSVVQGIDMFDCVMPTRNARKGSVFTSRGKLVVKNAANAYDHGPMDPECTCYACRNFSRAYMRHLFAADEMLGARLASLHSLTFYVTMMREMRAAIIKGDFGDWRRSFLSRYEEGGRGEGGGGGVDVN